ncbi:unnamed protein product [Lymnaea stagnalis]|uniref:C-type lectin domain-containing protein n=1 Tax=Lymnaea stagnalis TaxID=6523 RepID=A0AAV2H0C5_LYMST
MLTTLASILLLSALSYFASADIYDQCPSVLPRDQYLQVRGDFCYQFVVFRKKTHSEAKSDCESRGGTLALVKSPDIQNYLRDQLANTYLHSFDKVWIGLNDIMAENIYQWEDGTSVVYTNWADGEGPSGTGFVHTANHDKRDCVLMDVLSDGRWREVECESGSFLILFSSSETHSYVCQYRARPATVVVVNVVYPPTTPAPLPTATSVTYVCPVVICSPDCEIASIQVDVSTGCAYCSCHSV